MYVLNTTQSGGAAKRVDCVVVVDVARAVHIPRIARVVTISRAQAHVLRYSLHPYGKAPAICRSVYYLHLSNFSDILSHQWSSRSNISLALISSERSSLQAVSVQEDCYSSGQLSPEGLFLIFQSSADFTRMLFAVHASM